MALNLLLRPTTEEDLDLIHEIKRAAFKAYVEQVQAWDDAEERRLHQTRWTQQTYRAIVIEGEIVGYLSTQDAGDHLALRQLFIRPEHQGRGIGAECMRRLFAETTKPIRLRALKANPRALTFYLRLGFHVTDESATHLHLVRPQDHFP